MPLEKFLGISLLVIIFWIGVWGLVETLLQLYIGSSVTKSIFVYSSMIATVIIIIYYKPQMVEYFL